MLVLPNNSNVILAAEQAAGCPRSRSASSRRARCRRGSRRSCRYVSTQRARARTRRTCSRPSRRCDGRGHGRVARRRARRRRRSRRARTSGSSTGAAVAAGGAFERSRSRSSTACSTASAGLLDILTGEGAPPVDELLAAVERRHPDARARGARRRPAALPASRRRGVIRAWAGADPRAARRGQRGLPGRHSTSCSGGATDSRSSGRSRRRRRLPPRAWSSRPTSPSSTTGCPTSTGRRSRPRSGAAPGDGDRLPERVRRRRTSTRRRASAGRGARTQGRRTRRARRRGARGGGKEWRVNLTTENTAIVLDSTSDYPEAPSRFPNMRFVPLYVRFGDETLPRLRRARPRRVLREAARRAGAAGDVAAHSAGLRRRVRGARGRTSASTRCTSPSTLSGTYQSAELAATELGGDRVRVVDSRTASLAIAMLSHAIQRRLARGTTDEEIDALVERFHARLRRGLHASTRWSTSRRAGASGGRPRSRDRS